MSKKILAVGLATLAISLSASQVFAHEEHHHHHHHNVCQDVTPVGVSDLFQISRTGSSATLFFTPVNDHVNRYHIVYGHNEGEELFGQLSAEVTSDSNKGVQSITINGLDPNQQYSFQVIPVDGCATGTRSNWLTASKAGNTYHHK